MLLELAIGDAYGAAFEYAPLDLTSVERVGHCRGLREGIQTALRIRFGENGLKLMPEIQEIYEEEKLQAILNALETASSPDEIRRLWAPSVP